jgi:hypothetical protein
MHEAVVFSSGVVAVAITTPVVEVGLVAVALILLVALLVIQSKRARDQKLRKAASMGYYDPDVARYGYGSPAVPAEPPIDFDGVPLAPTFVAPGRGKSTKRTSEPEPPPAPGTTSLAPPRPVPAFDPASAISARPVSAHVRPVSDDAPPAPPPPPPPGASTLPPLLQPPPPVGAPTDRDPVSTPDDGADR